MLAIAPAAPATRDEPKTPTSSAPQTMRKVAPSQFVRIRTLVKYGMTVGQVAEVYGAAVGEIERILHKA